jgi:hypothetical protein
VAARRSTSCCQHHAANTVGHGIYNQLRKTLSCALCITSLHRQPIPCHVTHHPRTKQNVAWSRRNTTLPDSAHPAVHTNMRHCCTLPPPPKKMVPDADRMVEAPYVGVPSTGNSLGDCSTGCTQRACAFTTNIEQKSPSNSTFHQLIFPISSHRARQPIEQSCPAAKPQNSVHVLAQPSHLAQLVTQGSLRVPYQVDQRFLATGTSNRDSPRLTAHVRTTIAHNFALQRAPTAAAVTTTIKCRNTVYKAMHWTLHLDLERVAQQQVAIQQVPAQSPSLQPFTESGTQSC